MPQKTATANLNWVRHPDLNPLGGKMIYLVDQETFDELPEEAQTLIAEGPSVKATPDEVMAEFGEETEEKPEKPVAAEDDLEEFKK